MKWPYDIELMRSAKTGKLLARINADADDEVVGGSVELEDLPPDQIISVLRTLVQLRDAANRHAEYSGVIDAKLQVLWGSDKDKVA